MAKRYTIFQSILLPTFIVLLSGCSTMNDVVRVKENGSEGTAKVYPINED